MIPADVRRGERMNENSEDSIERMGLAVFLGSWLLVRGRFV